jgi:hypothetical protein
MPDKLLYFTYVPEPPTLKKEIGEMSKECILSLAARSLNTFVFFKSERGIVLLDVIP